MEQSNNVPVRNARHAKKKGKTSALLTLAPILLVMLVQTVLMVFVYQLAVVRGLAGFSGSSYGDLIDALTDLLLDNTLQVYVLLAYSIVCVVWFGLWNRREFVPRTTEGREIYFPTAFSGNVPRIVLGGLVFAIGAQYAANYLMSALAMLQPRWLEIYEQLMGNVGLTDDELPVALVLYTVLFGPVCEELTFRGLTFGYARRMTSFLPANIIQALLFGLLHGNMLQGTMAFCLGLVLGYIYEETQSITLVCLLHIAFNIAGVFGGALVYQATGAVMFFVCFLGGMVATYFGVMLLLPGTEGR